jgi:hypothetical protein
MRLIPPTINGDVKLGPVAIQIAILDGRISALTTKYGPNWKSRAKWNEQDDFRDLK